MKVTVADLIMSFLKEHKRYVRLFVLTFLVGVAVHFYMFSNKFYNYFEMNNILTPMSIDKGDTLAMGRWFLPVVSRLSSVYSMPAVNGLICLVCLSLVSCMLVDILQIKRTVPAVLCGAVVVSFPGVASYLSYGVNSDVFSVALLLAAASGWALYRMGPGMRGMAVSAVLLCFCIGVYQPFMSVTIAIVFCMLFLEVWKNGRGIAAIVRLSLRYVLTLAAGFVLYYLVLQAVTGIFGIAVGDYHGINEMTSFTPKGIAKGGVYTYFYFLYYLFSMEYANFVPVIVFNVLAAALFFWYTVVGYRRRGKGRREKGSLLCMILLVAVLPIGVNASPFLMADRVGNGVDRYMMFSMMLLYLLLIRMADFVAETDPDDGRGKRCRRCAQWLSIACAVSVVWGNYYTCNQGYYRAEAMTKSTDSLLNRLAYRIESTEGWSPELPVYLANCETLFNENCDTEIDAFRVLTRVDGTEIKPWYNYDAVVKYMQVYLNFPLQKISEEQQEEIRASEEFGRMGIYPEQDSMRMIDGVLVVKFRGNTKAE